MKDFRLHLIVLILIVVAEKIGNISITVGVGKIVLLPMMYALLMGVATAPRFTKISSEKNVKTASSLLGVTLMLHHHRCSPGSVCRAEAGSHRRCPLRSP